MLLLPFISVYSKEFADAADYYRPTIAVLFTLLGYLQTIRVPAGTIIIAAGHYRETRGRAIIESALNLAVALALVYPLGMSGVLIGSVVSYAWRSADMIFYNSRHLVANSLKRSLSRILRNLIAAGLFIAVGLIFSAFSYGFLLDVGFICRPPPAFQQLYFLPALIYCLKKMNLSCL